MKEKSVTASSSPSKTSKGKASKASILLAARLLFARKGFTATSLSDIEKAADTSRGVIYHYFRSKDEIIQDITRENLGRIGAKIESNLHDLNALGVQRLEMVLRDLIGFVEELSLGPGKAMSLHVWSLAMLNPEVKITVEDFFEKIRMLLKKELAHMQQTGFYPEDTDLDQLSSAFFSTIIPGFIVQRMFLKENSLGAAAYIDSIMALFKPAFTQIKIQSREAA